MSWDTFLPFVAAIMLTYLKNAVGGAILPNGSHSDKIGLQEK